MSKKKKADNEVIVEKEEVVEESTEEEALPVEDAEDTDVEEDGETVTVDEEIEEKEEELSTEDAEDALEDTTVIDLTEDLLSEEESEPLEEEKKGKVKKVLLITAATILGLALVVYIGLSVFFMNHFYFNTSINGVDQSMKTVEQVEEYMTEQVEGYELSLKKSDGKTETISGESIGMEYMKGKELQKLLEAQGAFSWPVSLWEEPTIEAPIGVSYDEKKLDDVISSLDCMKKENQVKPVSALPEYNGTEFVPKAEEVGSKVDAKIFKEKIITYLNGFVPEMDMTAEECYVKPRFVQDSPEVLEACELMNKYLNGTIEYDMADVEEKIDREQIAKWLRTNSKMEVKIRVATVRKHVEEFAKKYDTYQTTREFTSASGDKVKVSGGNYGWLIDQEAECKAIISNIKKGEPVKRAPKYQLEAASHGETDWGNTFVEVDLTKQRAYLFVDGKMILDKPCVTGNVNKGWYTPQGVYSITYCTTNVTLRGPKNKEGEYEWESPVTYWMPFNGSIGLHDASWQHAFGDPNGYTYSGSRGCVNLQFDTAQTIYNNVTAGTPVIVHY